MTGASAISTGGEAQLDGCAQAHLYGKMVLLRRFELAVQDLYRKGRIPGFIHLYIGQEAVAVGVCAHLGRQDWITSTHRGHGHALAKGTDPGTVLAELYGKSTGCCGGRGGSMHLYDAGAGLFGTNGFVAGGIPAAVGIGLSARVRKQNELAVAFFGDGAINHGAFHESINLAALENAPVIFVCENNLYATATPIARAMRNTDLQARAAAYGVNGIAVDGNDVVAVWEAMREAVLRARNGAGPTLIEAKTYRTVGHHEGDPVVGVYRTQEELDEWKQRCPILNLGKRLVGAGLVSRDQLAEMEAGIDREIQQAIEFAESSPLPDPETATRFAWNESLEKPERLQTKASSATVEQTWLDAVRDGIAEEMRRDPNILYLGEGIGERGGSFAHTKGLWREFGGERVIDTPISELAFTGAGVGAAATGCPAVCDLMFADFLFEAASQIVHQAGKLSYMSNGQFNVPLVVRAGMGAIKNAGPHHSGCYHPVWAHCPGLIVAVPSTPADAKGLFKSALRGKDPVIFLESKTLLASKGPVPADEHLVPLGEAAIVRRGKDLTLISCGAMTHRCLEASEILEQHAIGCDVIDLRTIVPLDVNTIAASVARTGRALVVDEAFSMCGLGAEIAAILMESAFDALDAPVGRLHTEPVAPPFSPALEVAVTISTEKIVQAAKSVVAGCPPVQRRAPSPSSGIPASPSVPAAPALIAGREGSEKAEGGGNFPETISIIMPNQDLTVTEGTVVRWLKAEGEAVSKDDLVVEIETAKAIVPIESPSDGVLIEISTPNGSVVQINQTLGRIRPR